VTAHVGGVDSESAGMHTLRRFVIRAGSFNFCSLSFAIGSATRGRVSQSASRTYPCKPSDGRGPGGFAMSSAFEIIHEVKTTVGKRRYSLWHFGLTNDVAERKKYWGKKHHTNLDRWQDWAADSIGDALTVEGYFSTENMIKGGTGGSLSSEKTVFVYVF
jgi:hypothetical protein